MRDATKIKRNKSPTRSSNLGVLISTLAFLCTSSHAFAPQNSVFQCVIPQHASLLLFRRSSLCSQTPRNEDESIESRLQRTQNNNGNDSQIENESTVHIISASTTLKRRSKKGRQVNKKVVTPENKSMMTRSPKWNEASSSASRSLKTRSSRKRPLMSTKMENINKSKSKMSTRRTNSNNSELGNKDSPLRKRKSSKNQLPINNRKPISARSSKSQMDRSMMSSAEVFRPSSQSLFQQFEMTQHEILTKETEFELGSKIKEAKKMRDSMQIIVDQRIDDNSGDLISSSKTQGGIREGTEDWENNGANDMYDSMILNESQNSELDILMASVRDSNSPKEFCSVMSIDDFGLSILRRSPRHLTKSTLVQDASKLSVLSIKSDIHYLTEEDVVHTLKLPGGKKELIKVLLEGAKARDYLMRSNIRLVVNISKKWMNRNYAAFNAEGARLTDLYKGGWDRPSLDEVTQEGVLGLARAVDKYDFSRGLRFSTYATHWITSYVRQCFQRASTGCLHVPAQLHDIKSQYKNVIKRYINTSEKIPAEDEIAKEIGVTVNRLRTAVRVTESLISIDQPIYSGNAAFKGSGASGDFSGANELILADTLQSTDVAPEDHIEISFLRQSLENAMAAELSPHERDILRLRLGLDDGNTRSVREVVDVCGGGISSSDVRSAERTAFKKLSSPNAVHAHNLLAYLDMAGIDTDSYQNSS